MKKRTIDDVKKDLFNTVVNEYTLLSDTYINNKKPLMMRHNICGHEYQVSYNKFFSKGNRCPLCFGTPKKSTEEFKKEVYDLVKDEYTVIGIYKKNNIPIMMRHNICGHEYLVRPKDFLHNYQRCPDCYNKKLRSLQKSYSDEEFREKLYEKYGNKFEILSEYKGSMKKILVNSTECKHEPWWSRPDELLYGISNCPKCAIEKKTSKGENELYEFIKSL